MDIQLFVPKFRVDECLSEIRKCLEKGWTTFGFKTIEFEDAWKKYTGFQNAHFLNSNTSGLHLALEIFKKRYEWSDGDEVISTPITFVSTNHVILHAGLKPIFADIDETLCLDPNDVIKKITPKTKAIMFVGIAGNVGQYEKIVEICKKHDLRLILDAAHMSGTKLHGKQAGHESDAAVFSFQAVKNLPTADSGMICFKDVNDDILARKLTWLGIDKSTYSRSTIATKSIYTWKYDVNDVGYKYHGNSVIAAIGLVSLKYLDEDNEYRRKLASQYRKGLSDIPKISLVPITKGCESSTHLFQIRVKDRDGLLAELNKNKIHGGVHYRDNTEYPMYAGGRGKCPQAHAVSKELLSLPLHLNMVPEEVDKISNIIRRYIK